MANSGRNYQKELEQYHDNRQRWIPTMDFAPGKVTAYEFLMRALEEVYAYDCKQLEILEAPEIVLRTKQNSLEFVKARKRKFAGYTNMQKVFIQKVEYQEKETWPFTGSLIINDQYMYSFGNGYPINIPSCFKKI